MSRTAVLGNCDGKNVIVLGIGNRLMGDDGIGNCVVEELIRRNALPGLRLIVGETDTDYCLDELEDADNVILIDASSQGRESCSVTMLSLKDILRELPFSHYPHHFDLLHAMKQQNYKGDGILLTVEACSIQYHFGLSSQMEKQFSGIVDEIYKNIVNYIDLEV